MPNVLENNARLHWRMTRMDATVRVSRIGSGIAAAADRTRRGGPLDVPLKKPGEEVTERIGSRHEIAW
jgi:hypothetical protein